MIQRLEEISGGQTQITCELLSLFWKTAERCMSQLSENIEPLQHKLWHDAAHELKGASDNLGFLTIARTCAECERADVHSDKKYLLAEVIAACQETQDKLSKKYNICELPKINAG